MAQLVRAPPCHGGGHGFESRLGRYEMKISYGLLAQLGEHLPYKQRVIGSSPIGPICRRGGTGRRTGLKILRDLYSRIGSIPIAGIPKEYVGIAQLDRASGYGPEGRGFESSCPRCHDGSLRGTCFFVFRCIPVSGGPSENLHFHFTFI